MRKTLLAAATALFLAGCVQTGDPQLDAILAQVQTGVKAACGVEIVAAQIVALIPNPIGVSIPQIVTIICAAVMRSAKRTAAPVMTVQVRIGGNLVNVMVQR